MQEIIVDGGDIKFFTSPKEYKQQLLLLITAARQRIFITALYLQDDDAGREILHALYQAKANFPELEINIFVDFNRGQRGLIGEKASLGNRALYLQLAHDYPQTINIYGVAVKRKEIFGVLHLKGMVFDDQLFYTGASINDIYLHQGERYRLDRYCTINSVALADSFCHYLSATFIDSSLAPLLNQAYLPDAPEQKKNLAKLKVLLRKSHYIVAQQQNNSQSKLVSDKTFITPLVGFGRRKNQLNQATRHLVQNAHDNIVLYTPYFNLPHALARDVIKALKRGVKITVVVGDKTANDFFISNADDFSTIGIIPYVYEMLLKRFVKRYQNFIDKGLLNIHLWKDKDNSFHLKGLRVDDRYHLITGSNLNPRAWALDLENGLLIDDAGQQLLATTNDELLGILANTTKIVHHADIESVDDYPDKPQKLLKKIRIAQIDRILKRFL
ncbi:MULTISPECIES: CDP-diacylglycerol--serine O-phosphatidyltransferase [Colwellia]|uniref:CDP-diacylglycerol--serine O-phosphatidyltransferase n=1 Tax=Colwellia marinimaniae TaxID=1513592 RepID=A0ABQ0MVN8_9GAMM|nr:MULTISPECIES: CDP-diacylglycerol--serine O-phosphatidyltransferase [Colwellia]GAW95681.1 CDP-diacylglycerol--serine O-phosphatidyltransferase [Colwellia marinimaniae]